jgi:hypothetical protein
MPYTKYISEILLEFRNKESFEWPGKENNLTIKKKKKPLAKRQWRNVYKILKKNKSDIRVLSILSGTINN